MEYYAFVHRDRDDGPWGAVFPDLPGCTAVADTLDELRATAAEALALHVESLREDGLPAPEPRPLEAVWRTEDAEDARLALPVLLKDAPGRVVRVNITIDESLLAEIDRAAGGYGRSGFLARGARVLLAARVAARDTPGVELVELSGGTVAAAAPGARAQARDADTGRLAGKRGTAPGHKGRRAPGPEGE